MTNQEIKTIVDSRTCSIMDVYKCGNESNAVKSINSRRGIITIEWMDGSKNLAHYPMHALTLIRDRK